mmetsp:Transcript_49159/g.123576  ORF Transcript_49159/g.123576 Transcript_49159/m.123576 type:complete len:201 (-) Transcript_49159:485-1087(-)
MLDGETIEHREALRLRQAHAQKDRLVSVLFAQRLQREAVLAQLYAVFDLHAEILHLLHFELYHIVGEAKLRDLGGTQATGVGALLEHGHILVAQTRQEGGTADRGGTTAHQRDLGLVAVGQLIQRRQRRIAHLRDTHLHEGLGGKVLQTTDVDRALLGVCQVTAAHAQIAGRAHHTTGETERVVRKDFFRCTIVVTGGNR